MEFTCPDCGSHSFGSTVPSTAAVSFQDEVLRHDVDLVRHCHDCAFTWPERDDPLYFGSVKD